MSRSRVKVSKTRLGIEKLLLVAGLAAVGVWVGSIVRTEVCQDWANWAFERKLHGQPATARQYLESWFGPRAIAKPPVAEQHLPAAAQKPPAIETGDLIGRLAIPRLKLQAIVREGAGAGTLGLALGHIPGTALPGQPGNIGVAGHRDSLFRGLGQIRKTDRIEFQTLSGSYEYEVESTGIVAPQTVSVLDAGQYPEITLVTCYPFHYVGSAPDRFIVKARLVSRDPLSQGLALESVKSAGVPEHREAQPRVRETCTAARRVFFSVSEGHSTTLAPGISLGLDWADAASQRVKAWMWVMPDRRTIWLTSQHPREPLVFYGHQDGKRREVVITNIGRTSVSGYLQLSGG